MAGPNLLVMGTGFGVILADPAGVGNKPVMILESGGVSGITLGMFVTTGVVISVTIAGPRSAERV